MGDKAIISELLEASNLTDAYSNLTVKTIIQQLKPSHHEASVKYEGLEGDNIHIGEPEDAKPPPPTSDEGPAAFTVDEAVELLGFGKFQIKLSILTGLAWMADAMELTILAIISPALQCDWGISSFEQALITTVVFCGMMLSSTFWGNICDRYGRKIGLVSSAIMTFSMGALSAFSPNYYSLLVLRGLTGFGCGGVPQSVTLYAEFLPMQQRAKCVSLIEAFWALGSAFEVVLAYFVMHSMGWRYLLFFSSFPILIFCLSCFWLPESARYQVTSGNMDLAYKTLARVAYENGRIMPQGKLIKKASAGAPSGQMGSLMGLFVKDLRVTTILLWIIWCANAFSYYGLVLFTTVLFQSNDHCHGGGALNATSFGECRELVQDDYLDLLSTTLSEFPGLIITAATIEWFGRKKTMGIEFGIYAVFTFLLLFCLSRRTVTIFIFFARAFISGAFQCAYVYTPEVYPTTLRAVGLGASSAMARFGAITTPFIAQVAAGVSLYIPIVVYGIVGIIGLIASFVLPIETKGRQMTESHI